MKTNFYDKLAAGTYERAAEPGVYYTTASYVQRIRDTRSGTQANMAAWDIGMGLLVHQCVVQVQQSGLLVLKQK